MNRSFIESFDDDDGKLMLCCWEWPTIWILMQQDIFLNLWFVLLNMCYGINLYDQLLLSLHMKIELQDLFFSLLQENMRFPDRKTRRDYLIGKQFFGNSSECLDGRFKTKSQRIYGQRVVGSSLVILPTDIWSSGKSPKVKSASIFFLWP